MSATGRSAQSMSSMSVGGTSFPGRVALAPMSGVTDAPVRRMAARFGAGWVVSEMAAADALARGEEEARLRVEGEGLALHVVQIAGCDPRWMGEGARLAVQAGAHVVDINMGCPAKRVTGGYAGSALMRDLDHACRLIAATVEAVDVPVTLKMRLGWDRDSVNAPDLARRAEDLGVRLVTVHGRTRQQFYKGTADWTLVRRVRDATRLPLVVNGDVVDALSARAALEQSGADAVMIGRGAQGKPWLPGAVAQELAGGQPLAHPDLVTQTAIVLELYEAELAHHGVSVGVRHARKHLGWALDAAVESAGARPEAIARFRAAVLTADEPKAVMAALRDAFDALQWRAAA